MTKLLSLLFVFVTLNVNAQTTQPLDDLMSPDEIAEESGLPRTEFPIGVLSLDDFARTESVNIFREFPVVLVINKKATGPGAQRMRVYLDGIPTYEWRVSTGRERQEKAKSGRTYFSVTPTGYFYPYMLNRDHWSETWQTPMPYSVFFNGGIARSCDDTGVIQFIRDTCLRRVCTPSS